ncbi:hypothetical protein [Crossiella sp. CA198]|uniref:hypothetical protein n=1 Tax=Crossiella sp. CA198 TaxID=3455607 RepID=UPI003F8D5E68
MTTPTPPPRLGSGRMMPTATLALLLGAVHRPADHVSAAYGSPAADPIGTVRLAPDTDRLSPTAHRRIKLPVGGRPGYYWRDLTGGNLRECVADDLDMAGWPVQPSHEVAAVLGHPLPPPAVSDTAMWETVEDALVAVDLAAETEARRRGPGWDATAERLRRVREIIRPEHARLAAQLHRLLHRQRNATEETAKLAARLAEAGARIVRLTDESAGRQRRAAAYFTAAVNWASKFKVASAALGTAERERDQARAELARLRATPAEPAPQATWTWNCLACHQDVEITGGRVAVHQHHGAVTQPYWTSPDCPLSTASVQLFRNDPPPTRWDLDDNAPATPLFTVEIQR